MKKFKWWDEDAPTNATGPAVVGTGDDSSTVVVKQKRPKIYKRKKRKIDMEAKRVDEARRTDAVRNYRKEYDNYHSQPEQRERNAARLRARRQMEKWGKVKKFDKKDVHHKDNNPLNNEKDNLAVTTQSWNRSEPRLRKEESINIQERELTPKELKRREEIAQDLSDADFKKRYGDRWKEVKMGVATNMAKKESIDEADDPKADKAKAKELKIAKAIAQAQLAIAKEQERVQKLTDLQKKVKDQAAEETTMNNKYFDTKQGTLEEATLGIWTDAAEEVGKLNVKQEGFSSTLVKKAVALAHKMGGDMTGAVKKIEKMKRGLSDDPAVVDALRSANEQVEGNEKVDGRTKAYKETIRRIKMRQERNKAKTKTVTEETLEEANITVYLDAANPDWMKKAMKKYGVKGKIHKRDVNPGYDSWKVTGDPKKLYKLYSDDEYGGDESFDDFIDMHKESVNEGADFSVYLDVHDPKWLVKAMKKYGLTGKKARFKSPDKGYETWYVEGDRKAIYALYKDKGYGGKDDFHDFVDKHFSRKEKRGSKQEEFTEAQSGDKEAYKKFFDAALKKFKIKSPADLESDEDKKKFYDYIDKNWEGDNEKKEAIEFSEKIEYVEYQFRNKNEATAAKKFFDAQQRMGFEVNDDGISQGLLAVDAGKNDMTEYHKAIVKKLKPKVISTEDQKKK